MIGQALAQTGTLPFHMLALRKRPWEGMAVLCGSERLIPPACSHRAEEQSPV